MLRVTAVCRLIGSDEAGVLFCLVVPGGPLWKLLNESWKGERS